MRERQEVVLVQHHDLPTLHRDPHRLDRLAQLGQPGRRRPVGEQQPIKTEALPVRLMIDVPAVPVVPPPQRVPPGQPVIDPLPHERPAEPLVRLQNRLVVGKRPRPVPHGVGVLAQQERQPPPAHVLRRVRLDPRGGLLRPSPDTFKIVQGRVHEAVEVGVPVAGVALVVQRPGGVAVADVVLDVAEGGAGAALVPERPDDHARVVLVAFDHAPGTVEQRLTPHGLGGWVALPAGVDEAVRLDVAFVDHPQPVLVAQTQELGVRRVVGGADGVDVVPLHQLDVADHGGAVEGAAAVGVVLVPVDAAEQHGGAVDEEPSAVDLDGAKADGSVSYTHL